MDRIKVLIVDEPTKAREIIRYALENSFSKIEIDEACSDTEAREKLENRCYDLVLCDWESRNIRGDELLKWIRNHPTLNKTSFIMVTSKNEKLYLMNALQSGVTSYLLKPFTVVGLIHRVMSVVSQFERREFERFYSDRPVSLKFKENQLDGNLIDISLGGLLGTFKRKGIFPQILEKVVIEVEPDIRTKISGIHGFVIRIQSAETVADSKYINIAIKFMNISSNARDELMNFFNTLKLKI